MGERWIDWAPPDYDRQDDELRQVEERWPLWVRGMLTAGLIALPWIVAAGIGWALGGAS